MKIQNINNYMNYKGSTKPIKNQESINTKKYDVIEINGRSSKDEDNKYLDLIKKNVVAQVTKETNTEKIERIKESIQNKSYSIDVEEIVKKMLK